MTRRSRIALTVGVVLVGVAALLAFLPRGAARSDRVIPAGDRRLPAALIGTGLAGEPVDTATLRGAPVVVNFWASWCGPCHREQPDLERAAAATRSAGVHFVGVNMRESNAPAARSFLEKYSVSYPSIVDDDFTDSIAYAVPAPPATFVLDAAGRIAVRFLGEIPSGDELIALIRTVAEEQA